MDVVWSPVIGSEFDANGLEATDRAAACSRPTTFLQVGPDTDVYALKFLARCELRVVFVEPLIARVNEQRINDFRDAHQATGDFDNDAVQIEFDRLYECDILSNPTCRGKLTQQHVRSYAVELIARLSEAAGNNCSATNGRTEEQLHGLSGFRLLRPPTVITSTVPFELASVQATLAAVPAITLQFESDGVRRKLVAFLVPVSVLNWTRALLQQGDVVSRPVSTLAHLGVSLNVSSVSVDALCGSALANALPPVPVPVRRRAAAFRTIRQEINDPQLKCADEAPSASQLARFRCSDAQACELSHNCRENMLIDSWKGASVRRRAGPGDG